MLIDPGFIDIARIECGGSVGALALVDGKPRICTVKCLTRCHFISLSVGDFKKGLEEIERKKKMILVNFLKNVPLFSKLTSTYLKNKLADHFVHLRATKDAIIISEGRPADRVYIIKEGEFIVTKRLI